MRDIGHFVDGKEMKGTSGRHGDVFNPNTGEVQAHVAFATRKEVEQAIANAAAAQPAWAATNPQRRARVLFKFLELVQAEYDDLAALLSSEHGKTIADAKGDIQRGLEVVNSPVAFRTCSRVSSAKARDLGSTSIRCANPSVSSRASRRSISRP